MELKNSQTHGNMIPAGNQIGNTIHTFLKEVKHHQTEKVNKQTT